MQLTDAVGGMRARWGAPIPLCVCMYSMSEQALMGGGGVNCCLLTDLAVLLGDMSAVGELAEWSCMGV